jgi:WD40 repeat protein
VIIHFLISTGGIVKKFAGHFSYINDIQVYSDFLYSGSYDSSIKKWKISTGELVHSKIIGKNVWTLFISRGIVYGGINFNSFTKFDLESLATIEEVKGLYFCTFYLWDIPLRYGV